MRTAKPWIAARCAVPLFAALTLAACAFAVSASAAAGFGIAEFEATTCKTTLRCTYAEESELYTPADGHPGSGVTFFKLDSKSATLGAEPEGTLSKVRTDLPLGLSVNPRAVEQCSRTLFAEDKCPVGSQVGVDEVVADAGLGLELPLTGIAYNLEPANGVPLEVGVQIPVVEEQVYLVGGVSWHKEAGIEPSGDYHEYFTISNISGAHPLLSSRLIFEGNTKGTGFLTLPSTCGPSTSILHIEDAAGETASESTAPPLPVSECGAVPFKPAVKVTPSTTQADAPDGATVEVLVPQNKTAAETASSAVDQATVTLPEGLTFNPAVANGLVACTNAQFGKGTASAVSCPAESQIGTAAIETPLLPEELTGKVYIGTPESSEPKSGKEYRLFIATETAKYGVDVRLEGKVEANEATGQLSTIVAENPPLPFSDLILKLEDGAHTPLANPITCGAASATSAFVPYTEPSSSVAGTLQAPFTVTGCAGFAPQQSTSESSTGAGAETSFAFTLTRPEGQPYVSTVSATLPPGLVGKIPSVPLCEEAQASKDECPAASIIGSAKINAGSGEKPYELAGTVYLTGPYDGAPYGAEVVTNAEEVGPYNYGKILTRAKLEVNPSTAQITVAAQLPTVVGGAPIRLRSLTVTVDHANFLINPTNCEALATTTALTSTLGTSASASSPFQVTGCSSLAFKPTFKAASNAKISRKSGAPLETMLTLPSGDANVKSVSVTLPKKLPSRESTLEQACLLETFDASPSSCPKGSKIGTASIVTPVLPGTLKGTAYYVSLGHAGFPNLDVVLKGDGVTILLVGTTNIKGGVTHTTFPTVPDVPVKTFELKLPKGEYSALSGEGSFCKKPLYLPTTIVGQNGTKFTQKTKIDVAKCPVVIEKHKVKRRTVAITVRTPSAGKIVASGTDLVSKTKKVSKAKVVTITEKLSAAGARKLAKKHKLKIAVRVKFTPKKKSGLKASSARLKVRIKG